MESKTNLVLNITPGYTHCCIKNTFDIVTLHSEKATTLIKEFNEWSNISCKNSSFLKTYFKDENIEWCELHKQARVLYLELQALLEDNYQLTMIKLIDLD